MTRVSDLPSVTSVAIDDLVHVVDVSDTGDDAGGSSKAITVADLGAKVLIETITNTAAGEFDFDNIPAGFSRLVIEGQLRGDVGSGEKLWGILNEDTTATNYHSQMIRANGIATVGAESNDSFMANLTGGSSPANAYASVRIVIEGYDNAWLKTMQTTYGTYEANDHTLVGTTSVTSALTAAITRVRLRTDNNPTDELFGVMRLYGEM
jgi:hypothetical protein